MASSGGATSDEMELGDVKGSRNPANRAAFSPAPQVSIGSRPGFVVQNSDSRIPSVYENKYGNPAVDSRWQNRQVEYADQVDQQPGQDRASNAERGYPPGFGPGKV